MLVSGLLEQRFPNLPLRNQAEPRLPTPSQLMVQQEAFINDRDAIRLSRSPLGDISRAIPETHEAEAELALAGRPSREQLRILFPEEVGDTLIYLISTAGALGVTPEEMEEGLRQRLEQRPVPRAPLRREARQRFHSENIKVLRAMLYDAQAHITDALSPDPITGRDEKAIEKVHDAIHQTWVTGKSSRDDFAKVVADKIDKNRLRFTPEEFRVEEGQDPHVVMATAYHRQKVREGKWERTVALESLRRHPAIVQGGITVEATVFANL